MSRQVALPSVFAKYAGAVSYVAQRGRNEYSSTCPNCGGTKHANGDEPDRCRWFTDGKPRGWCRHCGGIFWPDDAVSSKVTTAELEQWRQEREAAELRRKHEAERALEHLRREKGWLDYVALMDDKARAWWEQAGVPRDWQEYLQLGYMPSRPYYDRDGELQLSPAYTIPYFRAGGEFITMQYRLNAADPSQRYRFQRGLGTAYYQVMPDEPIGPRVMIVEGAKKAMVTHIHGNAGLSVLGVPSKADWGGVVDAVKDCERVYVLLDPDAQANAYKLARQIGKAARVMTMPVKVDDALLSHGLTTAALNAYMRQAKV